MATKTITEKTGKRMAAALEGVGRVDSSEAVKIPNIDSFDFETIALFAQNHGHYSNTELAVVPFAVFIDGVLSRNRDSDATNRQSDTACDAAVFVRG